MGNEEDVIKAVRALDFAPEGLQTVTGTVLNMTEKPSSFKDGSTYLQMIVKLANGSKVCSTVPKAATTVKPGDTIIFTATFTRAAEDPKFSFGKRPHIPLFTPAEPPRSLRDLAEAEWAAPTKVDESKPSILASLLAELDV